MRDVKLMAGGSIAAVFAMSERFGIRICLAPNDGGGSGGGDGAGGGDGGGAAGGEGAGGDASGGKSPESILFPGEGGGEKKDEADQSAGEKKDGEKGDGAGEKKPDAWKPYEDDPAKSKEENDKARAENEDKNPDNPLNKVPEDGKYSLKMPDGIELDTELAEAIFPEFKGLGLTNRQAQALTDKFIASQTKKVEAQAQEWSDTVSGWVDKAKKDKEIGGEKWNATVDAATSAAKKFGTPALAEFLNISGGGNHPEVIRFFARVGNAISEDKPAGGGSEGSGKPVEAAHVLFPNDVPKG